MKVLVRRPPNFDAILARFPMAFRAVLFAYGDVIYNPHGVRIPPELFVHEGVHGARQLAYAGGVEAWWEHYLADSAFMIEEEALAHVAEYGAVLDGVPLPSRSAQKRALALIADRLSGPLYGNAMSLSAAVRIIETAC